MRCPHDGTGNLSLPSHFHGLIAATVYPDPCEADFVISSGNKQRICPIPIRCSHNLGVPSASSIMGSVEPQVSTRMMTPIQQPWQASSVALRLLLPSDTNNLRANAKIFLQSVALQNHCGSGGSSTGAAVPLSLWEGLCDYIGGLLRSLLKPVILRAFF